MKKLFLYTLFLFFSTNSFSQKYYTISGYVTDGENGENLIGANVIFKNKLQGTTTNTYGFYSITVPEGQVELDFSYIGYSLESKSFNLVKDFRLNVALSSSLTNIDEVVVLGEENVVEKTQASIVEVPIEQIKNIPALFGEVDVLKAIQLLPGVQSGGEGSSGFYVRGGGPDQNLILLDGVPVYNASHLFGFFSVFNADAIKNVRLTKGGFPSRFGGRLSSVLEIDMKEGNMKNFQAEGSIGLISAKLTLQGPIIKDKTSFIVSGRRTYIDILAQPFIKSANQGNPAGYYFYDLNAKLNHKFSEKDRLYVSAYTGLDRFYYQFSTGQDKVNSNDGVFSSQTAAGLQWGNITSALRWNHLFGNKLFSNATITYSNYKFDTDFNYYNKFNYETFNQADSLEFNYFSGIRDYGAKIEFDYLPSPNHFIKFGLNYTRHHFYPGTMDLYLASYINDSLDITNNIDTVFDFSKQLFSDDSYIFIEDDIKVNDRLKVNIGLHLGQFYTLGKTYLSLQPRISTRYLLNKDWSIKVSYAEMQQNIHLLSNTSSGLPNDIWVPSTDSVSPQYSKQYAASVNHIFSNGLFEVSLEGYYKNMSDLITLKGGSRITGFDDWRTKIDSNGLGRSYGLELFLQKKKGKTTGWIGYTLSYSERKFENVNFGKWYPYKYDRRHDISIVLAHKINERIDLGLTWVYGTGNSITFADARYPSIGVNGLNSSLNIGNSQNEIEYFPSRNNLRMDAYHRLDFGVNFHKIKKWGKRTWSLGVYNAYSRKNPYYIYIDESTQLVNNEIVNNRVAKQVSLFPIIPSVSYKFKF